MIAWNCSSVARSSTKSTTLQVGDFIASEMAPYTGADGSTTTLQNTVFSTVPGSPAYVGRASTHTVNLPQYGMMWSFEGRNAIQSDYRITFTGDK